MSRIGIIGGTGLTKLKDMEIVRREVVHTPFGEPSGPVTTGRLFGHEVLFLARHGYSHTIPPHRINYRANIWAMQHLGVTELIAFAAVGGIKHEMGPGRIVIPDQIVDYTYSRQHTFFEDDLEHVTHIDFTEPYCPTLRAKLIAAGAQSGIGAITRGTYATMQGPRLETAAEINRLENDGCDLVGMTGMPEAALARELGLCYATVAVVANYAAGRGEGEITMAEIEHNLVAGFADAAKLLQAYLAS
ncbi:MAG: S-methyl-5'-thioinosine phosphorylase [Thiotrichales bacterium]